MATPQLAGVKLLSVDDDPTTQALIAAVFVRHGAIVTTCSSAEEGIAVLAECRFDLVVSDLQMTGLDGYDLVHKLRQMEKSDVTRPLTPTVAVSGNANSPSIKRRFADFQVYMQKPFNPERLVAVLERLVEADGEAVKAGSLAAWESANCHLEN